MAHYLDPRQDGPPPMPTLSPEYLAENQSSRLLAIECTLYALSMSAVLMRFYVRIFMLKMFGWDDWMMGASACLSTVCLALFVHVVGMGLGKHAEAFPLENVFPFFKIMYFYSVAIITAYSLIKLSIGFFLLRLVDRTRWRPFLIGMLIFIVVYTIGSVFSIIFQCWPVQAGWDFNLRPPKGTAKCYAPDIFKNIGVFNSSINIATDLLFALIPIPMVWRLQVNLRTRIGLAVILSLGLFASAIAIYKTPMQYNFFKVKDWSGKGAYYYIWQQVEMHIGIMAACLPTLKPLFASFFGQIRTFTKSRASGSGGISTPFKSNGYVKQDDVHGENNYRMKILSSSSGSKLQSPRDEDVLLGKEMYTVTTSGGRARQSSVGESDESTLSRDNRRSIGRGRMAIVST
ncbi:hypothetical protein GQ44DRAFT_608860 [Phaeosphaeriaceae sp. PMI808]|nr:hypothetical protein GQ44DRAFT_608860 [Phaeosphaeriaceae sp. PMI808]